MDIDWAAIGQVFGVSIVATVGLVGLFTLGIVGASRTAQTQQAGAVARTGAGTVLARLGGYACFALCAAAVAYGIHLIVA